MDKQTAIDIIIGIMEACGVSVEDINDDVPLERKV